MCTRRAGCFPKTPPCSYPPTAGAVPVTQSCLPLPSAVCDQGAKEELQETLEFARPSEGVAGPLRGAAAMKLLREVYSGLDKEGKGLISKAALLAALRSEPKVADLLKMPLITDQSYNNAGPAETFEDTFRKIDVDSSDNLSWPEFASYFGKSYLHFAG